MGAGDCTEMYIVVIDCFARSLFAMTAKPEGVIGNQ
jgi:hypothetical protein